MKFLKWNALCLILAALTVACSTNKKSDESAEETTEQMDTTSSITLTKAPDSPQYPEASLSKNGVAITPNDSLFTVEYDFEVANYELGVQTEDAATRGIANSGKGQHIHFIVNNGPYSAHYMTGVIDQLAAGNYVVLAFLSRSYHESVKSEGAYYIENITVGDVASEEVDLDAPHLFFSRPKGTYAGADTKKLMLDFYLLNTTLSADGNKVRATINGEEFMIDEWAPYYIEGLEKGEVAIKLELVDATGVVIPGPFNRVERTVMLEE
ncbi:hypothetical protein [Marinoscillum sp. MHG1-6]|uniref:hypothetical protein n=1 Tax=Marinoscillum sp. MHG1-6 TaxID=2959627 RepID=UPI0021582FC1|nr:hypothetical protein [Marinoscillum sp. MHG1-6]